MSTARIVLVTGTDTGVGKTVVGFGLGAALTRRGLRVRSVKPVETGCGGDFDPTEDGALLARATGQRVPRTALDRLPEPLAPPVAADRAGRHLDLDEWCEAIRALAIDRDVLLVEGAGGLLSPLTWHETARDLAVALGAEALVIAPDRLGSLNHILLTLEVLQAASVPVLGVVVNAPAAPDRATGTNVAALRRVGGIDRIASLSRLGAIEEAASHLGEVAGWLTP